MSSKENENAAYALENHMPRHLPIIPIRFRPVFPGMVTPLMISSGSLSNAVEHILRKTTFLGLLLQKDDARKGFEAKNLYSIGSTVKVVKKIALPEGGLHLLVNTLTRFRLQKVIRQKPYPLAEVEYYDDPESPSINNDTNKELLALTRAVLASAKELSQQSPLFTEEMKLTLANVEEPGKIADFVCSMLNLEKQEYQEILETFDIKKRLEKTLVFMSREVELLKLQQKIQGQIHDRLDNQQKEFYLREQLKAIRDELGHGEGQNKEKDAEFYRKKLETANLPAEAHNKAEEEIDKLEYIDIHSSEYSLTRNYLDTVFDLPWDVPAFTDINIINARKILNQEHFALDDVKNRIIEHLAVRQLKQQDSGSILCLVGPPGVGKTSLGRSIAKAMQRKFFRFSLGGMRDEAEIKGHRKTYVGAMPGKIIQAVRAVKENNAVLMLDEIDKLGSSFQGDPASALLEVLDKEQNRQFRDHYLDMPYDLSHINFITTANTTDSIPLPLLDRMEVIRLSGYILPEKMQIAKKFIIPRAQKEAGLINKKNAPSIENNALKLLIDGYSREAGVRSLQREIEKIYRHAAAAQVEKKGFPDRIDEQELIKILGKPRFSSQSERDIEYPGCALGLAYTSLGGATLIIECKMLEGRERFRITGSLGKVMKESAEIAFSFVKSSLAMPEPKSTIDVTKTKAGVKVAQTKKARAAAFHRKEVHIHIPDGATPKDGPSAGVTLATALFSLYYNTPPKKGFAMTGELRLTGEILPIGGLKEKLIAARRIGIKNIIFPKDNEKDWQELPAVLKKGIKAYPCEHYCQIHNILFKPPSALVARFDYRFADKEQLWH